MSEKDEVYAELHALRKRVYLQRKELTTLRTTTTAKENGVLRSEADNYRKALSNIQWRLANDDLDMETLSSIVDSALLLKGLKAARRKKIVKAHQ